MQRFVKKVIDVEGTNKLVIAVDVSLDSVRFSTATGFPDNLE